MAWVSVGMMMIFLSILDTTLSEQECRNGQFFFAIITKNRILYLGTHARCQVHWNMQPLTHS